MILDATAPHTRVDNFVIDDYADRIGAIGLGIYTVIKRHYNWATGQCTPSYNRIAQMCKVSRSTVIRYVKRLKAFGLIDPQMRFTDDGQTSNQYGFYQPERPKKQGTEKPLPSTAQKSTTMQMNTDAQISPPVSQGHPPGVRVTPDQVNLNKKEEKRNAKTIPNKEEEKKAEEKTAPTGKEKKCSHPEHEIIRPCNEVTICTACYELLE